MRSSLLRLWLGFIVALVIFCAGLIALILLQPERVGLIRSADLTSTTTAQYPTRLAAARTATAVDLLAVRNFEIEQTLQQRETEVVLTMTQSAMDIYGTATQLMATQQANVDSAYSNIVIQATLENELLIAQINATAIAIEAQATRQYVAEVATQAGVWFANTQAAIQLQQQTLDARESGIAQQETQTAVSIYATQTAESFRNTTLGTQAALDFEATRQAVDAQATQVELDFRGTQAALSRDATAVALAGSGGDLGGDNNNGTPNSPVFFNDGVADIINSDLWTLDNAANWRINAQDALVAQVDNATITAPVSGDFTLRVVFMPLATGNYIFQVNSNTLVYLVYTESTLQAVQLYQGGVRLADESLNLENDELTQVQLTVIDTWLYLTINTRLILNINLLTPIQDEYIGIQFPAGAIIVGLSIE
ncbi:MAG: hypothetical protein D6711_11700 [Chloroflexi bacterium]|nr:MAG: hypothetical protein D6711_11700 [Chloroflexota bacterium]